VGASGHPLTSWARRKAIAQGYSDELVEHN